MARQTPEQKVEALRAALAKAEAKAKEGETRKKVLYGAAFLMHLDDLAKSNPSQGKITRSAVERFITRAADREFLGLAPAASQAPKSPPAAPPPPPPPAQSSLTQRPAPPPAPPAKQPPPPANGRDVDLLFDTLSQMALTKLIEVGAVDRGKPPALGQPFKCTLTFEDRARAEEWAKALGARVVAERAGQALLR